jgi:hypothetical protein
MSGLAAATLCLALGSAQAQGIGTVRVVDVWAYGTPPGAQRQDRFVRDAVVQQELLETVENGSMAVRFADGTELRLGSASQATLDNFVYSSDQTGGQMAASLTRGAFRFISGRIDKGGVQLRTPTALIGIRGTDFLVTVAASGATVISVISGIVTVQPAGGGAAVAVNAGQTVGVAAANAAPAPTAPVTTTATPGMGDGPAGNTNSDTTANDGTDAQQSSSSSD